MTRAEHIAWCKERAHAELTYSHDPKQGITSMMSDLRKHTETNSELLAMLCIAELRKNPTEAQARKFIDGFN